MKRISITPYSVFFALFFTFFLPKWAPAAAPSDSLHYLIVKTTFFRSIELNLSVEGTLNDRYTLSYKLVGQVPDPYESIDLNKPRYIKVVYDELAVPREIFQCFGQSVEWKLGYDKSGNLFSYTENGEGSQRVITFDPQGRIVTSKISKEGELYEVEYQYSLNNGQRVAIYRMLNKKLISREHYAWVDGMVAMIEKYDGNNEKGVSSKIEALDASLFQGIERVLKTTEIAANGSKLSEKITYFNLKGRPIFEELNGTETTWIYDENDRVSREMVTLRQAKEGWINKNYFYYPQAKGLQFERDQSSAPLQYYFSEELEQGSKQLRSRIVVYNESGKTEEELRVTPKGDVWNLRKKYVGDHFYQFSFNKSRKIFKKMIYSPTHALLGSYHFEYDPFNRLKAEIYLDPNDRVIRKAIRYYAPGSKPVREPELSFFSLLTSYDNTTSRSLGTGLYESLILDHEKSSRLAVGLEEELPKGDSVRSSVTMRGQLFSLFESVKSLRNKQLVKMVVFDGNENVLSYVRFSYGTYKGNPSISYTHYSEPVKFYYSSKKSATKFSEKHVIVSPGVRYENDVDRYNEFVKNAMDNINPRGEKGIEYPSVTYKYLFDSKTGGVLAGERISYNVSGHQVEQVRLLPGEKLVLTKPSSYKTTVNKYITELEK